MKIIYVNVTLILLENMDYGVINVMMKNMVILDVNLLKVVIIIIQMMN